MKSCEDSDKGLMAVDLDGSGDNVFRYGRMKYDGRLGCFTSDCLLPLSSFVSFPTKADALRAAQSLRFPSSHVERIGSRFCSAWGIRHDFRDSYFLAIFD
jgi:hypothetical protein